MKKILMLLVVALVAFSGAVAFAEDYSSVVVSSVSCYPADGDSFTLATKPIVISSSVAKTHIKRMTISKSIWDVSNTVTFFDGYSAGSSTANVVKIWEVEMTTSTGCSPWVEDFGGRGLELEADYGLAITRSNKQDNIRVSIQYR